MLGTCRTSQLAAAVTNVNDAGVLVKPPDEIKLLEATHGNKLTLTKNVNAVYKATFFHSIVVTHSEHIDRGHG